MQLSEALARTHITRLTEFTCLADVLEPELIQSCLDSQDVASLRRRKLPMDAMIWAVIGMPCSEGVCSVTHQQTRHFFAARD